MSSDLEKAMQEYEEATQGLAEEVQGLAERLKKVSEYQSTLLRVNTQLNAWLWNIEELSKHRRQSHPQPVP